MSEALIDEAIEVGPERAEIDMWPGSSERKEICLGDELPPDRRDRTELGHRHTMTRDDKGLPGDHCVDHLRVVIAQLPLCDGLGHAGDRSTRRYGVRRSARGVRSDGRSARLAGPSGLAI